MELGWNNWSIVGIPFVILGGIVVGYILNHRKQKKSTDHILKL